MAGRPAQRRCQPAAVAGAHDADVRALQAGVVSYILIFEHLRSYLMKPNYKPPFVTFVKKQHRPLLAEPSVQGQNFSHEQVFGHLAADEFTAADAAQYLGVSISTFRRYVTHGKIRVSSQMGRNQLFATKDLKAFKRSIQDVKTRGAARAV